MKKTTKILLTYFLIWITLSIAYLFLAETITKAIFPGYDSVELWLIVLTTGLLLLFLIITLLIIIQLKKAKR